MKIKYINSETFAESEMEVEDFLYELADEIRIDLHQRFYPTIGDVSIILTSDKGEDNKLLVGFFKKHKIGEPSERYKITIEKLPNEKD